jgi:hypothetical protein
MIAAGYSSTQDNTRQETSAKIPTALEVFAEGDDKDDDDDDGEKVDHDIKGDNKDDKGETVDNEAAYKVEGDNLKEENGNM